MIFTTFQSNKSFVMDILLAGLLSFGFIVYHIFGQPRLLKRGGDVGARTLYHFAGVLLAFGVTLLFITWIQGHESPLWVFTWDLEVLFILTGAILLAIDLVILLKRWSKYNEDIPSPEIKPDRTQELNDLNELVEKLKAEASTLTADNEKYKGELAKAELKQQSYDWKLNELVQKQDEFSQTKREWENHRHAENISSQLALKEKEVELEKRFADKLQSEKENLQERYHHKMSEFMDSVTEKLERRIHSEKKNIVDDIFKFDGHTKDDVFELKRTKESIEKEKEILEKNKFLQEVDDRVIKSKEHVLEAKNSALDVKSENVELRTELKLMASEFKNELTIEKSNRERSVDTVLHKLELEEEHRKSDHKDVGNMIALLAEQTKGRFIELTSMFSDNLKDLEMRTMTSFREVRENLSDMKLQFGQEVQRLDGQQGQILNELEKYYVKNQEFVNKCQSLALEARSQNVEGHNLLNQVGNLYNQHKNDARILESQLQTSLDQVAVKEGNLANVVGESMLKLKSISDQQFIAMKDLALEKKDVNLLWREKNQEHEMNLQEVQHQKQDLDRMKQFLDQEKSHFNDRKAEVMDNARLTHQLYMTEHRYTEALKKAQSSQGFLTRIAKAAEYAMSKK